MILRLPGKTKDGGRLRILLAVALILASGPSLLAQPGPDAATSLDSARNARVLQVARQIMTAARFCTLVTLGEAHQPQARIVDPIQPDEALTVYVATNPRSRKVEEIRKDSRVTLLYFDTTRTAYVTLIGRATEVTGALKSSHYKPDWAAFFAIDKPETYTLYKIVPSRAEVVSAKDGFGADPTTWRPEIVSIK